MNNITTEINIYHGKKGFSIFQTTDIEALNGIILPEQDKTLYVGSIIELYDQSLERAIKWKVTQIEILIYEKETMLPPELTNWQGYKNPRNMQVIAYVEESEDQTRK